MPKEITHWIIAEKAYRTLETNSGLKAIIKQYKNLYLSGAVIMDTPFYLLYGNGKDVMYKVAAQLHDNPINSVDFGARVIAQFPPQMTEAIIALLLGVITHIHADSSFHPMVYYFSGKKDSANQKASKSAGYRHHKLETFLDLYFKETLQLKNRGLFSNVLDKIEMDKKLFLDVLSALYKMNMNIDRVHIEKSLLMHRRIQAMFDKNLPRMILQLLNTIPGLDFREYLSNFYPQHKPKADSLFLAPFSYRHPVTGENLQHSVTDLETHALEGILDMFHSIERNREVSSFVEGFRRLKGPNLYAGVAGRSESEMKYFDANQDLMKLIVD
jgi:hypothetical protein